MGWADGATYEGTRVVDRYEEKCDAYRIAALEPNGNKSDTVSVTVGDGHLCELTRTVEKSNSCSTHSLTRPALIPSSSNFLMVAENGAVPSMHAVFSKLQQK